MTPLDDLYGEVTAAVRAAGLRLRGQAGALADIGGDRKEFLTSEDLRIEAELTALVRAHTPGQRVFGEELSPDLVGAMDDVWVIDPISGTETFLAGMPHYAVVVAHVVDGDPVFAVVHDPAVDELFTARRGQGAWLGDRRLRVRDAVTTPDRTRIVAALTRSHVGTPFAQRWWAALAPYDVVGPVGSYAVHYAGVAAGRYDGVIARTKDAFPEFAGCLLVTEAGGQFLTADGGRPTPEARWFYAGGPAVLPTLAQLTASLRVQDRQS